MQFVAAALGVGIAHPAFPHQINKVWEVVEPSPSPITQLLWSVGLIPIPVGDYWSFVLDVLFCGLTHAAVRYHGRSNMPYWKVDKFVRNLVGPNPFRAHDAIGARGANFLTWSCLHHLSEHYGGERFVKVMPLSDLEALDAGYFDVRACNDSNRCELFVFAGDGRAILLARLDNLGKGASGAAVQSMNVHLGLDEGTGLNA